MKTPCSVIQDLLPLYAEDLTSEDSRKLVEEHLPECEACTKTLEELKEVKPVTALTDAIPLQLVKQLLKKHTVAWCVLVGCLVAAIAFAVVGRMTTAEGVPYTKNALFFARKEEKLSVLVTSHSPDGVAYQVDYFYDEMGREMMSITGYTSPWLRAFGKEQAGTLMVAKNKEIRYIYYSDQSKGGTLTLLHGEPALYSSGGGAVLPRLVLNYYLFAALFLTALFGVLWLVFREKAPGPTLLAVALAFGSYVLAHFSVKGLDGTTYFLLQDLAFILLTALALWGAAMAYLTLRKLGRQW